MLHMLQMCMCQQNLLYMYMYMYMYTLERHARPFSLSSLDRV